MVRTTIACAWCRRSKIKCIHEGRSPCRNCLKSGRTDPGNCVLKAPELSFNKPRKKDIAAGKASVPSPAEEVPIAHGRLLENVVGGLSKSLAVRSASHFKRKFPELAFLHLADFDAMPQDRSGQLFNAALITLCASSMNAAQELPVSVEELAQIVRDGLSRAFWEPPDLIMVQTLLVFSMYEWGCGRGYSAWMNTGTAIRMMQSLKSMSGPEKSSEQQQEVHNRTFWSCFIMDRLVFSGRSQPLTLPLQQMKTHIPVGDQDFAFGQAATQRVNVRQFLEGKSNTPIDMDHHYTSLVLGFDIWARILKWIIDGGRRQPGVPPPWAVGSSWRSLYEELQHWRLLQHNRIRYPETAVAVQISLGNGESFAYVNLIYYVSILFLGREYTPLLPTPDSIPRGPVDPPLLEDTPPENWWVDRANELFESSAHITTLLEQLEDLGSPLLTPFAGFCGFTATTGNIYVNNFPRMGPGSNVSTTAKLVERGIAYLDRFTTLWKMGEGWCKTVRHTQSLYGRVNKDRARFQGKTRDDFVALEASMNDYTGVSPVTQDSSKEMEANGVVLSLDRNSETEAAMGLQELSHSHERIQPNDSDLGFENDLLHDQWNEVWPLWGEQQYIPLAISGVPFDYNMDLSSLP